MIESLRCHPGMDHASPTQLIHHIIIEYLGIAAVNVFLLVTVECTGRLIVDIMYNHTECEKLNPYHTLFIIQ